MKTTPTSGQGAPANKALELTAPTWASFVLVVPELTAYSYS